MPIIAKVILILAVVAYIGGGVGIWLSWLRVYQDVNETIDPIFTKLMLIGFIGLWVFFLAWVWYVNRQEEIIEFLHRIAKK